MTKLNLNKLMGSEEGFLDAIQVNDRDKLTLSAAREKIRERLRYAFRNWSEFVTRAELQGPLLKDAVEPKVPIPKFRIQGSFAYFTANDCQSPPAQQIDQDDGVFLPLTFVTLNGTARPTIASSAYFTIVEKALEKLCADEGWTLNPKRKNSCVRVEISSRLHIDLPLYAIRDEAFERLVEVVAADSLTKSFAIRDSRELDDQIYRELADAEIILAHRQEGWIESDPRRLERWFKNAINVWGPVVRDLSRCFKGLRDAKFDDGLSSICIMASVVRAIESLSGVDGSRLDIALVDVAREIASNTGLPVENPVFRGDAKKHLCAGWTPEYRDRVRALFEDAADELDQAINQTFNKTVAVSRARRAFGARVPDNEDLITLIAPAEVVRNTPPQRQPEAQVPRTKSG